MAVAPAARTRGWGRRRLTALLVALLVGVAPAHSTVDGLAADGPAVGAPLSAPVSAGVPIVDSAPPAAAAPQDVALTVERRTAPTVVSGDAGPGPVGSSELHPRFVHTIRATRAPPSVTV